MNHNSIFAADEIAELLERANAGDAPLGLYIAALSKVRAVAVSFTNAKMVDRYLPPSVDAGRRFLSAMAEAVPKIAVLGTWPAVHSCFRLDHVLRLAVLMTKPHAWVSNRVSITSFAVELDYLGLTLAELEMQYRRLRIEEPFPGLNKVAALDLALGELDTIERSAAVIGEGASSNEPRVRRRRARTVPSKDESENTEASSAAASVGK